MSTPRRKRPAKKPAVPAVASKRALAADVGQMIEVARQQVAQAVNAGLTTLYWQIGARIRQDILRNKRAEYGSQIVSTLSRQLEPEFGRGFGEKNLRRMVQFAETFPDPEIVAALLRQLGWTYFTMLIAGLAEGCREQLRLLEQRGGCRLRHPVSGDIVLVPFPFTDLTSSKGRPSS